MSAGPQPAPPPVAPARPSLGTVLREWGRIGCIGFGGPPAHIRLLRKLCVERRHWLDARDFEDANAACSLLPGPASTQLAIFCAWRVRGRAGALAGGAAFIVPGLIVILALSALFLAGSPPLWVLGAGAGAGAAVPAVAVQAGTSMLGASWRRRKHSIRWLAFLAAGAAATPTIGVWLVLVLLGCGVIEVAAQRALRGSPRRDGARRDGARRDGARRDGARRDGARRDRAHPDGARRDDAPPGKTRSDGPRPGGAAALLPMLAGGVVSGGVLVSIAWVALKVGGLSFGGGFVIIPLMQSDAVSHYHWMTGAQFLNAVALGQITPGPVVQTVAVVGYAAAGFAGGMLASAVAFTPSFAIIMLGASHFDRLRGDRRARAFLDGAGPAAIGAILGSAITLGLALTRPWQYAVLAAALVLLLPLRRGIVLTLVAAAAVGVILALVGAPLPR